MNCELASYLWSGVIGATEEQGEVEGIGDLGLLRGMMSQDFFSTKKFGKEADMRVERDDAGFRYFWLILFVVMSFSLGVLVGWSEWRGAGSPLSEYTDSDWYACNADRANLSYKNSMLRIELNRWESGLVTYE